MGAEYPYPPRMMSRGRAAHYCDLSEAEFEREVAAGRLPTPIKLGNRDHWSRKDLDLHLDSLTAGEDGNWRLGSKFYSKRNAA